VKFNLPGVACTSEETSNEYFSSIDLPTHSLAHNHTRLSTGKLLSPSRFFAKYNSDQRLDTAEKERFSKLAFFQTRSPPLTTKKHIRRRKMPEFKKVELFGGAITVDFPAAFGDVRYV
jgi:hypothetical protein